ncbi:2-C-methyl-D-erythritol 4-phosphate cytidylyltransferase [Allorhodopirellula solitaria]|uniref:2-C-methyl-D-erythritol 4-phosphate cytidylyltransferase n=1 Tax=Allorhodopirellula solitaria TaxID=2527987 RepID=A0A5C5YET7_9BACT|nr:2-C-methyl-D-erythritol 4-phosphate cytidylyltransferase [Allorhodopirellula solitaria]TWT72991.1 2-C-methyl-D-erythritol 4-phosphate cytidylyltransferase [Allorhodopirellula solitaria]
MTTLPDASVAVILPAAGSGQRFGDQSNKLFAPLAGRPLWTHAAETLLRRDEVSCLWLAVSPGDREQLEEQAAMLSRPDKIHFVNGGAERSDSVAAALDAVAQAAEASIQWVAVHDAARPLLRAEDVSSVLACAAHTRAAILATPVTGTLKRGARDQSACQTLDRRGIWVAQTPQVFSLDLLRQAYASHRGRPATDDAELVERTGHPVALVAGAADNLKITYPEDLAVAEALLQSRTHLS